MSGKEIYGVCDRIGKTSFYLDFYDTKEKALIELERQMNYMRNEFGWEGLIIKGNNVCDKDGKIYLSIDSYILK